MKSTDPEMQLQLRKLVPGRRGTNQGALIRGIDDSSNFRQFGPNAREFTNQSQDDESQKLSTFQPDNQFNGGEIRAGMRACSARAEAVLLSLIGMGLSPYIDGAHTAIRTSPTASQQYHHDMTGRSLSERAIGCARPELNYC